jgi:hypothetical protein
MAVNIPIWPGSSSFFPDMTPFGYYDNDYEFQQDTDKVASWCAKRLGYPIVDIELQDINFYACFEEAVTEYSTQVNQFNIRENLLNLKGAPTSSNLSQTQLNANLGGLVSLAKDYGSEVGSGGRVTYYTGSFTLSAGQQVYDLTDPTITTLESGSAGTDEIEIKKVLHNAPPAMVRYFDPFVGTGLGSQQMMDTFGWGNYSPGVSFMMQPLYDDLLRLQAIEFNDMVRKSQYGFDIQNNRIRIFPRPEAAEEGTKVFFHYILNSDRSNPIISNSVISDYSNAPFDRITYTRINHVGKRWIQKYTLALVKEMLGAVRAKFSSIPIPNSEVTLDGSDLRSEATTEKEVLIAELRENLEATSRKALLEAQKDESEYMEQTLNRVPRAIYIGSYVLPLIGLFV